MQSVNAGVNQRDVIPATLSRDATLAQGDAASAPYEAQTGLNRALIANALSPYGPASPETTGNISYLNPNTGKVEFRPGNIPSAANYEAQMYKNLPRIGKKMTATGPDGKEIPTPGPRPDAVVTPTAFGAQQPTVSVAPSSSKKKATTIAKKAATIIAPELKVAFEKKEKADKELAQRDLIGKIQTERDNLNTAINTSTTQFTPYGAPSGVPISLEYRNAQILKSRKLIADLEAELKKTRK